MMTTMMMMSQWATMGCQHWVAWTPAIFIDSVVACSTPVAQDHHDRAFQLPLRKSGTCYHRRSRHCRHCRLSSVHWRRLCLELIEHWRRNCFADRTTTHTSSIDTSLICDVYCGPEVLFETCVAMKFVDNDDDDDAVCNTGRRSVRCDRRDKPVQRERRQRYDLQPRSRAQLSSLSEHRTPRRQARESPRLYYTQWWFNVKLKLQTSV